MPISQRLPHTETLTPVFAPLQRTEGLTRVKPEDKHPALIASERVLRDLYRVIAQYNRRYRGLLPESVGRSVQVLRDALLSHDLAEQSVRLQVAVAEIHAYPIVAGHVQVQYVLTAVEQFLASPLPE